MTEILGNVILVGEAGAGKSSIINMIAGTRIANTLENHPYYILPVHGRNFRFFDTAGFNGGEWDAVGRSVAIVKLHDLIAGLDDGINLLMFCMRGPRINNAAYQSWKILHDILCKKQIRFVLVITGLEGQNMDGWWWNNRWTFEDKGIYPVETACITAIRGRTLRDGCRAFDEHYEKSQAKISNLILSRVLRHARHVDRIEWFCQVIPPSHPLPRDAKEIQEIVDACGMSWEETLRLKRELRVRGC
jgi:hypothetical protein